MCVKICWWKTTCVLWYDTRMSHNSKTLQPNSFSVLNSQVWDIMSHICSRLFFLFVKSMLFYKKIHTYAYVLLFYKGILISLSHKKLLSFVSYDIFHPYLGLPEVYMVFEFNKPGKRFQSVIAVIVLKQLKYLFHVRLLNILCLGWSACIVTFE